MVAMKKQMNGPQPGAGVDEMEMMISILVDQAKCDDELFIKEGVTSDELEQSLMFYMSQKDPEVMKVMQQYMMDMQKEMGFGGMMPGM